MKPKAAARKKDRLDLNLKTIYDSIWKIHDYYHWDEYVKVSNSSKANSKVVFCIFWKYKNWQQLGMLGSLGMLKASDAIHPGS